MILHNKPKIASLLHRPLVVGSVALASSLESLAVLAVPGNADVVELRLDAYPSLELAELPVLELPVLITARCPAEGGQHRLDAAARGSLLRKFLPKADLVDVEISSLSELREVCAEVHAQGAGLVASFHDFQGTPSVARLENLMEVATEAGVDMVKFATTLHGPADLATLLELLALESRPPLSLMGMGPLGKVSRLVLARLGSVLNYGFLDAATVSGQWEARRLKELWAEIFLA